MPRSVQANASNGPGCGAPSTPRSDRLKAAVVRSRATKSSPSTPCTACGACGPVPRSRGIGNRATPSASVVATASTSLLRASRLSATPGRGSASAKLRTCTVKPSDPRQTVGARSVRITTCTAPTEESGVPSPGVASNR